MADYDNHYEDLTERYLLNRLSEEEMADFQTRLLHDARLRREVQVMRALYKSVIAARPPAKKGNLFSRNKGVLASAAVLLILLSCLFVYLHVQTRKETPETRPTPLPPQTPAQQPAPENVRPDATPLHRNPAPVAASLAPNPALERYIDGGMRGGADHLDVDVTGSQFKRKGGKIFFHLLATLDGKSENPEYRVNVFIFSNKRGDYENSRPEWMRQSVFSYKDGQFGFDIAENVALHPGLHYYLVENGESGEILKVGKFVAE